MNAHPALLRCVLQPLALFFCLLGLNGCVSTPDVPAGVAGLPPGTYKFDCPIVYENGMATVSNVPGGVHVQLLEKIRGSFELQLRSDGSLTIAEDEMSYPGLRRSFSGEGRLQAPEGAAGEAAIWIKSMGPVGRDHRKGSWVLRPATEKEISRYERRQRALEERKRKAGMLPE